MSSQSADTDGLANIGGPVLLVHHSRDVICPVGCAMALKRQRKLVARFYTTVLLSYKPSDLNHTTLGYIPKIPIRALLSTPSLPLVSIANTKLPLPIRYMACGLASSRTHTRYDPPPPPPMCVVCVSR